MSRTGEQIAKLSKMLAEAKAAKDKRLVMVLTRELRACAAFALTNR